ncbi:MAG TPA: hypothetical protein VIC33_07985, partial [Vicinamibacterales bacterium]
QGAAARSSELLVSEGFEVNVALLEPGEDPDTFIRTRGAAEYQARLRHSTPYLEFLLDRAASAHDLTSDEGRRQFLGEMLAVAARIPDAAGRDRFGDRLAHQARITEDVVRAEIRKAAVARQTSVTTRAIAAPGELRQAEKGLIWALVHDTPAALSALGLLDEADMDGLAAGDVFQVAQALHREGTVDVPAALLRRLSTRSAELVAAVAAESQPPAPPTDCAHAVKRRRCEQERAAIQQEIDRLQQSGAGDAGGALTTLLQRKTDLLHQIEQLMFEA